MSERRMAAATAAATAAAQVQPRAAPRPRRPPRCSPLPPAAPAPCAAVRRALGEERRSLARTSVARARSVLALAADGFSLAVGVRR